MNQKRWLTVLGFVLLVSMLLVAGCGQQAAPDASTDAPEEDTAEETQEAVSIMIAGSDSEVNLVTRMAEEYMKVNPNVSIAVTGGGSGVGITALIDGTIDIANSSRPMKDEEMEALKTNSGLDTCAVRFAVDGVAVVVNENNPVTSLTVDQIGAIYRGEITNWSEVGGEDLAITLYGRQSTSGTYVFFMEKVVQADYSPEMRNMPGTSDIVESVTGDAGGIGYAAIGYATKEGIKALEVAADASSEAFTPVVLENVTSGDYPLTRPLYQYSAGEPSEALLDFYLYEVSEAGQAIVLEEGFYPITAADIDFNKAALE
jgi:phosphate transport system substrate-binding protein